MSESQAKQLDNKFNKADNILIKYMQEEENSFVYHIDYNTIDIKCKGILKEINSNDLLNTQLYNRSINKTCDKENHLETFTIDVNKITTSDSKHSPNEFSFQNIDDSASFQHNEYDFNVLCDYGDFDKNIKISPFLDTDKSCVLDDFKEVREELKEIDLTSGENDYNYSSLDTIKYFESESDVNNNEKNQSSNNRNFYDGSNQNVTVFDFINECNLSNYKEDAMDVDEKNNEYLNTNSFTDAIIELD